MFQERLIFYPQKLSASYKFKFDTPFEEVNHTMSDGVVINTLLFTAQASKGVVFYQHGNAGSLEHWGVKAKDFTEKGYDVFMYDYRGFGKSGGAVKNEKMLYNDALFLYQKLLERYEEKQIVLYGISLGTGIAAKLANRYPAKQLILETPYTNFYEVSKFHYPYLPNSILLHYRFKTDKLIPEINMPIAIFHGTDDETVPYYMGKHLSELSPDTKFITIKEGSHNDLASFPEYHRELSDLLH